MNENDTNWFRPLWRRVAVTLVVVVWFGYETLFSHELMWIAITGFGVLYCVWNFFLRFPQPPPAPGTAAEPPTESPGNGAPKP